VLDLPIRQGIRLITKAFDERLRERVFQQYLAELPALKGQYSFEQYYQKVVKPQAKIDTRPMDELMQEILSIQSG
jgi:hypothetical protein